MNITTMQVTLLSLSGYSYVSVKGLILYYCPSSCGAELWLCTQGMPLCSSQTLLHALGFHIQGLTHQALILIDVCYFHFYKQGFLYSPQNS